MMGEMNMVMRVIHMVYNFMDGSIKISFGNKLSKVLPSQIYIYTDQDV